MLYQLYNSQALLNFRCTEYRYQGTSRKVIIQSSKSKVDRTLNAFLQNSENETLFISLIKEELLRRKSDILKLLKSQRICISACKVCELVNGVSCIEIPELSNDQEELDKKVCLHALSSLRAYPDQHVVLLQDRL